MAVIAMIAFHFTWDLGFFQLIDYDISFTPEGRWLSHAIAGTFLFLVGVSLALAHRIQLQTRAFLKRFIKIAGAAALVSLGTYYAMPEEWIFFGVLHCIALSSLLALPLLQAPLALVGLLAILALSAPFVWTPALLDHPALYWLGLNTTLPRTNDYVPLLPWFGIVGFGLLAARVMRDQARCQALLAHPFAIPPARLLSRIGRYALPIYLLHQPVLMGALWVFVTFIGPFVLKPAIDPAFFESCTQSCAASGRGFESCDRACRCLGHALAGSKIEADKAIQDALAICRKDGAL